MALRRAPELVYGLVVLSVGLTTWLVAPNGERRTATLLAPRASSPPSAPPAEQVAVAQDGLPNDAIGPPRRTAISPALTRTRSADSGPIRVREDFVEFDFSACVEERMDLETFLACVEEVAPLLFVYNEATQQALRTARIAASSGTQRVPSSDLEDFLDWFLMVRLSHVGLGSADVDTGPPRVVRIMPQSIKICPRWVLSGELEECAARNEIWLATYLHAPGVDLEALATPPPQGWFPGVWVTGLGDQSLLLCGSGSWVARTAELLREIPERPEAEAELRAWLVRTAGR